jgi:hypothetical protein
LLKKKNILGAATAKRKAGSYKHFEQVVSRKILLMHYILALENLDHISMGNGLQF